MRLGIVDPYSTGSELCERLSAQGVQLVHIDSGLEVPETMRERYARDLFDEVIPAADLLDPDSSRRGSIGLDWIIAGSESGVGTAVELSRYTRWPMFNGEGPTKYGTVSLLEKAGLLAPRTDLVHSADELDEALGGHEFPVVVKPLWSATGDGVRLCADLSAVQDACRKTLDRRNIYGVEIDTVLIQAYLDGPEYYCNLVSRDGQHAAFEVWRYTKQRTSDGGWMYSSEDYIPVSSPEHRVIADYCVRVLDAVEFLNGSAHLEVIVTSDGPALVEANYRLGGATAPDVIDHVAGASQVKAFVDMLVSGRGPSTETEDVRDPVLEMRNVFLRPVTGGLVAPDFVERIGDVPGVRTTDLHRRTNGRDTESTLLASPGFVFLVGADTGVLTGAERQIRAMEGARDV